MHFRKAHPILIVAIAILASLGISGNARTGGIVFPDPLTIAVATNASAQDNTAIQKIRPSDFLCRLTPLVSTRADVERFLGKGKSHPNGFTEIYENDRQRVDVLYSKGPCKASGVERWNVPEDTVIRMETSQKKTILLQDLDMDPTKYTRVQLSHPDNWIQYWNREDGLIVHTIISGTAEELYLITREPPARDKSLKCTSP